jgi:Na+/phosphate symporter
MKKNNNNLDKKEEQELIKKLKTPKAKRTTFKLTLAVNKALNKLSKDHNIPHNSIFAIVCDNEKMLNIAVELAMDSFNDKMERITRTLLVNENTLNVLKKTAKEKKIKRDNLASAMIIYLLSILETAEKEEMEGFQKAENVISEIWAYIEKQKNKLEKEIGKDHPVIHAFGNLDYTCNNFSNAIFGYLYNDEPFDPDNI